MDPFAYYFEENIEMDPWNYRSLPFYGSYLKSQGKDEKAIETLIKIQADLQKASQLYKDLAAIDKQIKRLLLKM